MRPTRFNFSAKRLLFGALAAMLMFSFTSCAKKMAFLSSSIVPAAQGSVKVKTDNNKNYAIQIEIDNLADPSRLTPPREIYVVWMDTSQETAKKLGQIKTSSSMFSKNLKASFETVSSVKPVKIFITAENDPNVLNPDWEVVLSTDRF
jgi:hypothetical protein